MQQQIDEAVGDLTGAQGAEGREEGGAHRRGVGAQLARPLGAHPLAVLRQHAGGEVAEEVSGEAQGADLLELGDFGLDAGEADRPRLGAQGGEGRGLGGRRPVRQRRLRCARGVQEQVEPHHRLRPKPRQRRRVQAGLVAPERRADQAVEAVGRRRLQLQGAEALVGDGLQLIGMLLLIEDMRDQPVGDRLAVGNRRLAHPEELTDLGAVVGDGAPLPVVFEIGQRGDLHLSGEVGDDGTRDVVLPGRELALVLEGLEQRGAAQAGRARLVA